MSKYDILFKYIELFSNDNFGEWVIDKEGDGSIANPIHMPYVTYSQVVDDFVDDIHLCWDKSGLQDYNQILKSHNIEWASDSMNTADVSTLSTDVILALMFGAVRADRFCEGALLGFLKNGSIQKWLIELKNKDED